MTCFASIGVKQIQGYLARSRRLWGRRGASDVLAYLTDTTGAADRIAERSFETAGEILQGFPGATVNDEAVDVDSVLNIQGPDEECDLNYVPNKAINTDVKVAMSNSLGFGGHNSVIVMKKFEK